MRCQIKKLVASGNWSNPAIWDGGALPNQSSIVCLNGFNLNVDQTATVRAVTNNTISNYRISLVPWYYSQTQAYGDQSLVGEILTGGSIDSVTYPPFRIFDQDTGPGDYFRFYPTAVNPVYIGYKFPTARIVDKIWIQNNGTAVNNNTGNIAFEASNDGVTWTTLLPTTNIAELGTYLSPSMNTTTAYTHYRLAIFNARNNLSEARLYALNMLEANTSDSVSTNGGLVTFDSGNIGGIVLTCTDPVVGFYGGNLSGAVATYAGTKTFTLNASLFKNHVFGGSASSVPLILHSGTGTLNIVGNVVDQYRITNNIFAVDEVRHAVPFNNRYGRVIQSTTAGGTTNFVGEITIDTTISEWYVFELNTHTLNITGNFVHKYRFIGTGVQSSVLSATNCVINIVGNVSVSLGRNGSPALNNNATILNMSNCQVSFTGEYVGLYANMNNMTQNDSTLTWSGSGTKTISWIGKIETQGDGFVFNVFTGEGVRLSGPIVCSPYGWYPITGLRRVNWIQNAVNTYIQFRNDAVMFKAVGSTPNPAYNLVSPDTLADLPAGDDVRLGVTYGAGSFVGTVAVPPSNRVSAGIPVDDTVGTALLTPEDVWNHLIDNIDTPNSIGERLKNAATVETTGAQIASFNS